MDEQVQFTEIIKYLLSNTIDNTTKWTHSKSIFNSDIRYKMETSTDANTTFRIEISIDEDTGKQKNGNGLFIYHSDIPGGFKGLYPREFPKIKELEEKIFDVYVRPILKPRSKKVYTDILNSLGKQNIRDEKLSRILENN